MHVLLDTNALLAASQFRVDIYEQLKDKGYTRFVTLDRCVHELKELGTQRKLKADVAVALDLMVKNSVVIVAFDETKERTVDDAILAYAKAHYNRITVATLDAKLIERLKREQITVIRLRQRRYMTDA